MIKRVSLLRGKASLTRDQFIAHWSGPHVEIVRELPGVRGLRLSIVQSWSPQAEHWDGIGELWFDSREAATLAFATQPYADQLEDDRAKFIESAQVAFVEEITVISPPDAQAPLP